MSGRPTHGAALSSRAHDIEPREEESHRSRIAKLEAALQERDRRWQHRIERLEDNRQADQRKLQGRIAGLEREVALLRRNAHLQVSAGELRSGERFAEAVAHLSERVSTLDRAAGQFATEFDALRKALREMVWALAMPRRVHSLARHFRGWLWTQGPPALAHACRESRRVACRTGRPTAFHGVWDSGEWDWFTGEVIGGAWDQTATWFDVRHDVLQVQATCDWSPSRVGDLCQRVENVLLSCNDEDGSVATTAISCLPYLLHPAYFTNLKLVQLEMPGVRSLLAGQNTTIGEAEIFGQRLDEPFYIDLDDEGLVQRLAENIRNRPGWFRPTADDWLSNIRAAREGWYVWVDGFRLGPPAEGWAGFQNWLTHYWLTSLQKCTPLSSNVIVKSSGSRKHVRWDHPWVQAVKKHIPVIQRVARVGRDCD
ncbi:hypothetical protein SLS62_005081 [Diatrype stigma]|uniref:2EXR domain-containing protein n=1 Tax=Diatrype stigma TaxID=117547 RepID=A0AAN9UTJ9_9PEZI